MSIWLRVKHAGGVNEQRGDDWDPEEHALKESASESPGKSEKFINILFLVFFALIIIQ